MRKSGLAEKYVRIVQYMYDGNTTAVRCAVGVTDGFEVTVGLHQGSALSPCLFAMVMDRMTDEIREETPWTMMFADDIVICSDSKEPVEEKLESWIYAMERRGMKVNRRKTEYMCVNERQDIGSGTVKMQGEEVRKLMISNTWAQLYKVRESAEEKWRIEYRQDGMGGEEYQEWSATGEYQLEWRGRCTRWQWDQQCCTGWRQWHWRKDRRQRWRWQSWRCCDFH